MIINWNGKPYSLDFADIDLHQAEVIEKESGMPLADWMDALGKGTNKLQFLRLAYWLMLAQNGEEIAAGAVNFKLLPFSRAFAEAMAAEESVPEEPPDPTRTAPAGPTSPSPTAPPTPGTSPNGKEGAPVTVS